ncbi:MAG: mucoidy inhibitor MuiA family protein [Candidatus Heimdallarchaeota archaeon]
MSEKKYTELKTTIDRVVVYLDGARIYRSGKTELKKGIQQVRVKGLTKRLLKDSVRVTGKGKGALGAIDIKSVYQEEVSHEALNKLIQDAEKLQKDLVILQEKLAFAQKQNNQLAILSENFSNEFPQWFASGESKLTTLSEFIAFESKSQVENQTLRKKLEDDIKKLNKKLNTIQAEINKYQARSKVEQTYEVVVTVDVATAGPFLIEFSYQAKGVNWEPTYDIDLLKEKAVLKGMAQVINRTLEDWKNVKLEISTAVFRPIRIIEPNPFYIDVDYPRPPPSPAPMRSMKAGRAKAKKMAPKAMMEAAVGGFADEMEDLIEAPEAEVKESPAGVQSYDIPGKWSIPTDGNNHPVTLTTHELKTAKEFYWGTNDGLGVIARDKITNGDEIILAGNAKVYSDGEFIGETYVEQIAPKEDFKLGAREEMKIKAEKKLLEREKEKAGIVKGKRAISYKYEIKLKNFRKEDSVLTVKDIIPHSQSERIKVKPLDANVEPEKKNLGIYTWKLTLKPDQEVKITYTYEVEWEKDYTIYPSLP